MTHQQYLDTQKWSAPTHVDDKKLAFGIDVIKKYMPAYDVIPDEFKNTSNNWVKFQQHWFYKGLADAKFTMKPGVVKEAAIRHLAIINQSFEPKHEHKEAAVAYLASRWFDKVEANGKIYE